MLKGFKRILILAPHTDDGELGVGGTIAKLIENNAEVYYMAFSTADKSVPKEFPSNILKVEVRKATQILGIKPENLVLLNYEVRKLNYVRQEILEELTKIRSKINFNLIIMPSLKDIHQDHITVAEEALRAFKNKTILGYELIWNNLSFQTTCFVELDKDHVEKKCLALKEYSSQKHRAYMKAEFIYSLARIRGVQIGVEYAEAFEVIRWIIN